MLYVIDKSDKYELFGKTIFSDKMKESKPEPPTKSVQYESLHSEQVQEQFEKLEKEHKTEKKSNTN